MRIGTRGAIGDCSFYASNYCANTGGPYLWVNRNTIMPSELSEAGFHTNPTQNQLFMNREWKKFEAKMYYWSILDFFDIERPFAGICVGIISDEAENTPINGAIVTLNGTTDTTDTYETLFYKYSNSPEQLRNGFFFFEDLPDGAYLAQESG